MSRLPKSVWTELSADFAGPMPDGSYLLIIVDEYSRFPVVEIIHSTSADTVIAAMLGNIEVLKTDNGPPWSSNRWKEYAAYRGFKHRRITPSWPRADAIAEREVRTIMKAIRSATVENKNWKLQLNTFLESYRNTPHSTTNKTPSKCIFGRKLRTRLPDMGDISDARSDDAEMRETDTAAKQKMKQHADSHNHARERQLVVGDTVLVRQQAKNKLSSYYEPKPYVITDVRGTMITAGEMMAGRRLATYRTSSEYRPTSAPHPAMHVRRQRSMRVRATTRSGLVRLAPCPGNLLHRRRPTSQTDDIRQDRTGTSRRV